MDIKEEDRSEESQRNHVTYYKSLARTISDVEEEKKREGDQVVRDHLDKRIEAMQRDKKRIRGMFPDVSEEQWDADPV